MEMTLKMKMMWEAWLGKARKNFIVKLNNINFEMKTAVDVQIQNKRGRDLL